jgi:hypothetical protein
VELNEFKILVRETRASDHGHSVTSASMRGCAAEVGSAIATGGENSIMCPESVERSIFLVVCDDTLAFAVLHDQV